MKKQCLRRFSPLALFGSGLAAIVGNSAYHFINKDEEGAGIDPILNLVWLNAGAIVVLAGAVLQYRYPGGLSFQHERRLVAKATHDLNRFTGQLSALTTNFEGAARSIDSSVERGAKNIQKLIRTLQEQIQAFGAVVEPLKQRIVALSTALQEAEKRVQVNASHITELKEQNAQLCHELSILNKV